MRFYGFVSLLVIALILDVVLLGLGSGSSGARTAPAARAAALAAPSAIRPPSPTPTDTAVPPSATPTATSIPPTPTLTPSLTPTLTPSPTATPLPRLVAANSAAFTPRDRAVRANIHLALNHYFGALTHVVLPPGGVFSFNSALGVNPPALPWKDVVVKPTDAPAPPPAEPAPDAPPDAPAPPQRIEGGGLCDLASRYVMAARPLLPARAFRFVNHFYSNGVRLSGVPLRDSVSIWAVGGGASEHDLLITNVTDHWLEFRVERDGEKITVYAGLWDGVPPDW